MNGFVKISRYAGMREDLVQAGGGNSSYKESSDRMLIKASGCQLADLSEESGYAVVNPLVIQKAFLEVGDINSITEDEGKEILKRAFISGSRPSIETFLHAVSRRYTLHTHPTVVNVLACRENGIEILMELFPEAMVIPYATPGVELAKAFFKVYKDSADKGSIVFLENHGLVVSGDTADEIVSMTEYVTETIERYLQTDRMKAYHSLSKIWGFFEDKILWKVTDENVIRVFNKYRTWNHAFCPDCIVFLGKKMLNLLSERIQNSVDTFVNEYGMPAVIVYENQMYICADSVKKALEMQSVLSFSAQVMELNDGEECNFLSDDEQNFLLGWDAEKYRQKI